MRTFTEAQAYAQQSLSRLGRPNAVNEARWLIQQLRRDFALPAAEHTLTSPVLNRLQNWLQRLQADEPFQYVLGNVDFFALTLLVGPGVLIPRPETELLVEEAITAYPGTGAICDLCTGSGAVALALAHALPHTQVVGIDISEQALYWAERNLSFLQLANVTFFQGDLLRPLTPDMRFSLLTANPPYVAQQEYLQLPPVIRKHEPRLALEAGHDGLDIIRRIVQESRPYLLPDATLLLEIGSEQGPAVLQILSAAGYDDCRIIKDYAQLDRIAKARCKV
ncbi:MAG: peptide chain release factor N(5)-glutamine methyltransferase [Oligosphaeraceae bacterium]|nr:peptide chain release factor N(5)-glutamine methyltransferase [Oligosphaeraceae bacterium]